MPYAARPRLLHRPRTLGTGTVQLEGSQGPWVLEGLTDAQREVLGLLDGAHTTSDLYHVATRCGAAAREVDLLLALLHRQGLLDPLHLRRGRTPGGSRVLVDGTGRLADAVNEVLRRTPGVLLEPVEARSGTGHLAGRRSRHGAGAGGPDGAPAPDLVLLPGLVGVEPARADRWVRDRVPHLAVVVDGDHVTVGPLVAPPPAPSDACLRCVELYRCERDERRLGRLVQGSELPPALPAPVLPVLGCLVGLVVGAMVEGHWLPAGVTVEVTAPWPRVDHRRWERHPRCCQHG